MTRKVQGATVMARKPHSEAVAASRKPNLCADDIVNLIQPVALELLGTPNRSLSSQREWRYGSNGSLSVAVAGKRVGRWFSFEDGVGGGVLDLIARERGGSRADAALWLKSRPYAGHLVRVAAPAAPAPRRQPPKSRFSAQPGSSDRDARVIVSESEAATLDSRTSVEECGITAAAKPPAKAAAKPEMDPETERAARRAEAVALWQAGWAVHGTPAELYLIRRGLHREALTNPDILKRWPHKWPETLRFSTEPPGIALLVAVNDARTGLVCGVQRIFLDRDGNAVRVGDINPQAKKPDRKLKLSLGLIDGNAARFSCWPDPEGRWGLAEGPETALAAEQLCGFPVWAAISAGNMAKIDPPHWAREASVFADRDPVGMQAAAATASRLSKMPSIHHVRIIRATVIGADVADMLKESPDE